MHPDSRLSSVCSIFVAVKLLVVWMVIVGLDFAAGFRLEYFWPLWLMLQSVIDAYKYQGIVSATCDSVVFCVFFVIRIRVGLQ